MGIVNFCVFIKNIVLLLIDFKKNPLLKLTGH